MNTKFGDDSRRSSLVIFVLISIIVVLILCCLGSYAGKGLLERSVNTYTAERISVIPGTSHYLPSELENLYLGMRLKDISPGLLKYEGRHIYILKKIDGIFEVSLLVDDLFENSFYFFQYYPGGRIYSIQIKYEEDKFFGGWEGKYYKFQDVEINSEVTVYIKDSESQFIIAHYPKLKRVELWNRIYFFRSKNLK